MQQTIIIPSRCLGCGAERKGVQDGEAVYECGTKLREERGMLVVLRSPACHRGVAARLVLDLVPRRVD